MYSRRTFGCTVVASRFGRALQCDCWQPHQRGVSHLLKTFCLDNTLITVSSQIEIGLDPFRPELKVFLRYHEVSSLLLSTLPRLVQKLGRRTTHDYTVVPNPTRNEMSHSEVTSFLLLLTPSFYLCLDPRPRPRRSSARAHPESMRWSSSLDVRRLTWDT